MTAEAIQKDLNRILPLHFENRNDIAWLQDYHAGKHDAILNRVKTTRTDVNNKLVVNYAKSFTRDIVGYFLGKPIQYTNRKGKYRKQMENFTHALEAENKDLGDYQIAQDLSICGIGYRGTFVEKTPINGTHLKLSYLDPMDTFIVYPTDPTQSFGYAVTMHSSAGDQYGLNSYLYFNAYTVRNQFDYKSEMSNGIMPINGDSLELVSTKDISFGGMLPIEGYVNNMWRMGDWETEVSLMDALDTLASDGVNDIQQAVNSVLVAMGMELTQENFDNLSINGFLNVQNIPQGTNPVVEFINQAMDSAVGQSMRDYVESTLRVIVGVPDRKTRGGGGGDTGDAVFMRDGWQDIDLVASSKEQYFIEAERKALAVMLYILDTFDEVKNIDASDIEIHFNRNKTSNLQSKAQVYQILSGGRALSPEDALGIADLTNNVSDVIMRLPEIDTNSGTNSNNGGSDSNGTIPAEGDTNNVGADGATGKQE